MFRIALKYGILIVVFIFLWGILEYMAGLHSEYVEYHPVVTLLSLVIPLIFLYYGIREAQKVSSDTFTYARAFTAGLCISLVVAVLNPLGQWIFFSFVSPEFFSAVQAYTEAKLLAEGVDVEVARRQAVESSSMSSYLWQSAIGALVAGIIISAIVAIFVRDKALPKGG